jgi:hypothetical protein
MNKFNERAISAWFLVFYFLVLLAAFCSFCEAFGMADVETGRCLVIRAASGKRFLDAILL